MTDPVRDYLKTEQVAQRLQALRAPSVWRFIGAVLLNYSLIAAAILCATRVLQWSAGFNTSASTVTSGLLGATVVVVAVILIAARQHALLVLMHEGAHRSISRNRLVNDTLSDLLCGAPLLVSTRSYRTAHLAHHQHLNTERDPDWCRKVDNNEERKQWLFPANQPLAQLLAALYGHSVTYLLKSLADNQRASSPDQRAEQTADPKDPASESAAIPSDRTLAAAKYALYAVIGTVLTISSSWTGFLLYWLAPMLLVLPLIMRIRSIAEHFALRHDHPLRQTRTVRAGWLERLILAPHHIGLHIDHHLLASVPFHQLPKLHELLLECPDYRDNAHLNDGYFLQRRRAQTAVTARKPTFSSDLYGAPSDKLQPEASDQSPGIQTVAG